MERTSGDFFMNYVFSFFMILGIIFYLLTGRISELMNLITKTTADCGSFVLKLLFLTAFFSGILKIGEGVGITSFLKKLLSPLLGRIFDTKEEGTLNQISLNISSNMLGIGNAATPSGLLAMKKLDQENKKKEKPSKDMCRFLLFNTCSVQLLPTTILGLRAMAGSKNPSIILFPVIMVSITSLVLGLFFCNLILKRIK